MKKLILSCFILASCYVQAQSIAKGYVYEDLNKNGKRDKKEKGIAGVAVSNGLHVVATDAQGFYQLPVGNDHLIFISKPVGYQVPLDANNLPRYYYNHKPAGSPADFKYQGVAPTGALPKEINFALYAYAEDDNYTALLFGDPQPRTAEELGYFAKGIVSEVENIKGIRLGISLGDLVSDALDLHRPYIEVMKRIGLPWYNVMGNHDMNFEAKADSLSDETFEAHFGPANYSFNYGQVHYLILDDILYPDPRDGKGYWGGFTQRQLDYIENDLKLVSKDKLIILSFHIPLQQYDDSYRIEDRQRLFRILKDFNNTLILSAHTHLQRNDFYTKADGWLQDKPLHEYNAGTTSGDWYSGMFNEQGVPASTMRDGTLKGYAFLHFQGNRYSIEYKVAGKPKEYQMELYAPKVVPYQRTYGWAGIYANFFMGTANDVVEYRIDNGQWMKLNKVNSADPSFEASWYEWDTLDKLVPGRRPSNAVDCTHLWMATFPTDLTLGEHHIEVKATDRYGKSYVQSRKINVQEAVAFK